MFLINNTLQDTLPCRRLSHMRIVLLESSIILLETKKATNKEENTLSFQVGSKRQNKYYSWKFIPRKLQILAIFSDSINFFSWKSLALWYELLLYVANCSWWKTFAFFAVPLTIAKLLQWNSAGAMRPYRSLMVHRECFPANWILFCIRESFPPWTICNIRGI